MVDIIDFLGLYLVLTRLLGKGEMKVLVTGVGMLIIILIMY